MFLIYNATALISIIIKRNYFSEEMCDAFQLKQRSNRKFETKEVKEKNEKESIKKVVVTIVQSHALEFSNLFTLCKVCI